MTQTLFHMWKPFREHLIANHNFYVEQAQKRLLSQFLNMEAESEKYAEEWLDSVSHHFDPENHDPGAFYEQAHEESIEFYQMLDDMQNRTRLSVVAGMYHEWDKQLRTWIIKEMRHWNSGEEIKKGIWNAKFGDIITFLEAFKWPIRTKEYYAKLDKCRLVINAYKHGNGSAFTDIKVQYPELINVLGDSDYLKYADHTDLRIEDSHVVEFSKAIVEFWEDVPEYIQDNGPVDVPNWFAKAYEKDQEKV